MNIWRRILGGLGLLAATGVAGCSGAQAPVQLNGQVQLTLLHTADIHSRLFPYDLQINTTDSKLGLGPLNAVARIGGAAKIGHVLGRERARSGRVLHLDGGDCFQGAPIFNFFNGEAEIRTMTELGTDAMVVANHEFDKGALNVGEQLEKWASFPVLAANYKTDDPNFPGSTFLSRVLRPFTSFNLDGLKVGVIGMGNLSTLSALFESPNNLGILALETNDVAQFYIDLLRPQVDLIVFVTHLGLEFDEKMIANTSGIDVVLGGHNHIVLQPPKPLQDCQNVDAEGNHYINIVSGEAQASGEAIKYVRRRCDPRSVLLTHSGAFAKYVGRLDLIVSNKAADIGPSYDPINGFEVVSNDYKLIPVTEDIPEDPNVRDLLTSYQRGLDAMIDLDLLVGYSPAAVSRVAPAGGDAALGNMISSAMWLRQGIQTDFSLTNTTGIRSDFVPGPVDIEELYNVFPFDNSITKMSVSGVEVQNLFDFTARRSASRGCVSQVQIAGARVVLDCNSCTDRADLTGPCMTDSDCAPGVLCDTMKRSCIPSACARQIYIGRNEARPCLSDNDCGPNLLGSCDLYKLDASKKGRCWTPIQSEATYQLATSNYLAGGGSGFRVLRANTTQLDTLVQQRDALTDFIRQGRPCGWDLSNGTPDGLKACSSDNDCGDTTQNVCACVGHVTSDSGGTCSTDAVGCSGGGRCVLKGCRDSVAAFHDRVCKNTHSASSRKACEVEINPCELGGEECKYLACVDQRVGNFTDGRVIMEGR